MVKIFITGCAKSGTTLLSDMFRAFSKTYVINEEISLEEFCNLKDEQVGEFDFVIGKRSMYHIFSHSGLTLREVDRQIYLIRKHNILILNVVRDGRNVVASYLKSWGVYNPFEWMSCIEQLKAHGNIVLATVRYEDIINNADDVQAELLKVFNLTGENLFSEYPNFVPQLTRNQSDSSYNLRELDTSKITPDKETYLKRPNDIEHFNKLLTELNYEV